MYCYWYQISLCLLLKVVSSVYIHDIDSPTFGASIETSIESSFGSSIESSIESSSCPLAEDIKPCVCIIKYGGINLDCSAVSSSQQLKTIFHAAYFPMNNLREFYMAGNKGITVLEDDTFGNVTFTIIFIMRSALEKVETGALDSSRQTALQIDLLSNNIKSFPFHSLEEFSVLEELRLYDNHLSSMPLIKSNTLKMLDLSHNPLMELPVDAFHSLTVIEFVALTFTNISYIPEGLFHNVSSLHYILLGYNNITSLPTDVITCSSSGFNCGEKWLTSVSLEHNPIKEVQQHAFEGHPGLRVDITGTALTSLNETVWRPLIEANVTLSLYDTPLSCECDMAWMAVDPPNMGHVFGSCTDGRRLQHLDPKDFANCTLNTN